MGLLREQVREVAAKRKQAELKNAAWQGYRKFVVYRKVTECDEVASLYLVPQDGRPLPEFLPGQFLTFRFQIPHVSKPVVRCYSLSDRPREEFYRCSIRRVADKEHPGVGSNFVHQQLHDGDVVDVKAPQGEFYFHPNEKRLAVFVGAGVGITPLMSMIASASHMQSPQKLVLFYGVRNSQQHIFRSQFLQLSKSNPNFRAITAYSQPLSHDRVGVDYDIRGRVQVELIQKVLPAAKSDADFYICGPGEFMDGIVSALEAWGVPESNIHFESFGPSTRSKAKDKSSKGTTESTSPRPCVKFAKHAEKVEWNDECSTLLELAESLGIGIDSSCRSGNCGTCLTRLLSGEVTYETEPKTKVPPGHCLPCIVVPKSEVVIDA